MHVRRGARRFAQGRHAEFAPVLRGQPNVAGKTGRGAQSVVVMEPEQVEPAFAQELDPAIAALVDAARFGKMRQADIVEFAIGEIRTEMAQVAAPLADKQFQAAFRRFRIGRDARRVFRRQRIAEFVERRPGGHDGFLKRGERLGEVDHHGFRLMGGGRGAENLFVAGGERRRGRKPGFQRLGGHGEFPRVQHRRDALGPQVVRFAVPAEPAVEAHVEQGRGIAVDPGDAETAGDAVGKGLGFLVTGRAAALAVDRQVGAFEQRPAIGDGGRLAGDPVARVRHRLHRPRAVRQDQRDLVVVEGCGRVRRSGQQNGRARQQGGAQGPPKPHRLTETFCVRRWRLSPS